MGMSSTESIVPGVVRIIQEHPHGLGGCGDGWMWIKAFSGLTGIKYLGNCNERSGLTIGYACRRDIIPLRQKEKINNPIWRICLFLSTV
jgi:hypothetical protein